MSDFSCGVRMWAQVSFVLSQSTPLTDTDRLTDGQKGLGNTVRCITCSPTVKPSGTKTCLWTWILISTGISWATVSAMFLCELQHREALLKHSAGWQNMYDSSLELPE